MNVSICLLFSDLSNHGAFGAALPPTYEESLTEARNLLARESLKNPDMDDSLIEIRKLLALERKCGTDLEESVNEAQRLLHSISIRGEPNDSISEVHNLLVNASHSMSINSPRTPTLGGRSMERSKLIEASITAMVEEKIKAEEELEAQKYPSDSEDLTPDLLDGAIRGSSEKGSAGDLAESEHEVKEPRGQFHVTFADDTKGGLDMSGMVAFDESVNKNTSDASKQEQEEVKETTQEDTQENKDEPDLPEALGKDSAECNKVNFTPAKYEEQLTVQTISTISNASSCPLEFLNESFTNQQGLEKLEEIKDDLEQRLSSTPVAKEQFEAKFPPIHTPSPSTVQPRRFSTLTITKEKPDVLDPKDFGIPTQQARSPAKELRRLSTSGLTEANSNRLSRKELFEAIPEINPKRISTSTITKSRPSLAASIPQITSKDSSRKLFGSTETSLRSQSASPGKSPKGKILPTRFAQHPSPMGDTPVRDHLSPNGRHISPTSPSVREAQGFAFPINSGSIHTATPQFRPDLPVTPLQNSADLPLESPMVILPQVQEKMDFPVHSSKVTSKLVKHERERTATKESPLDPAVTKPPVAKSKEKEKTKEKHSFLKKSNKVAPNIARRSTSSGPPPATNR